MMVVYGVFQIWYNKRIMIFVARSPIVGFCSTPSTGTFYRCDSQARTKKFSCAPTNAPANSTSVTIIYHAIGDNDNGIFDGTTGQHITHAAEKESNVYVGLRSLMASSNKKL
jgi:hypothetical protein